MSNRSTSSLPGRKNSAFSNVSRGSRYKLAEDLTRESGRYSTRVAAWKRNFITPSGKALDRMIEKKTVPDPILDEQDRLEDNVRPLESMARFGMEVVSQWKKYVYFLFVLSAINSALGRMNYMANLKRTKEQLQPCKTRLHLLYKAILILARVLDL